MDANEIDKLAGRALDAAVAEFVMEWTWREYPEVGRILANTHDAEWVRSGVVIENGKTMYVENLPHYSTDWAAVGPVMDYLMLDGWRVEVGIADEPWYAMLTKGKRQIATYAYRGAVSEHVATAICHAALRAVLIP